MSSVELGAVPPPATIGDAGTSDFEPGPMQPDTLPTEAQGALPEAGPLDHLMAKGSDLLSSATELIKDRPVAAFGVAFAVGWLVALATKKSKPKTKDRNPPERRDQEVVQ